MVICSLLLLGLTACEQPRYLLVISNNTDATISNIRISFSGQTFPINLLGPAEQETAIFDQPPLGEQLTIQWQAFDVEQQQSFNTFNHIPRNHHPGKVVIRLLPGGQAKLEYLPPVE